MYCTQFDEGNVFAIKNPPETLALYGLVLNINIMLCHKSRRVIHCLLTVGALRIILSFSYCGIAIRQGLKMDVRFHDIFGILQVCVVPLKLQ